MRGQKACEDCIFQQNFDHFGILEACIKYDTLGFIGLNKLFFFKYKYSELIAITYI